MTDNGPWPTVTGTLYGYGALPWARIRERLADFVGVWGDVDGMHLAEPLPAEAPAYTHVWAWQGEVYARVRLDLPSDRHVLGVFVVGGEPPEEQPRVTDEGVTATVYTVRGWGDLDRVKRLAHNLRDPKLERLVTQQTAALTFVRPIGASP